MPVVKTKKGIKHFPYTKKGKQQAEEAAKKEGKEVEYTKK